MDLDEWEVIPHDLFQQTHDDGGKKIFPRKSGYKETNSDFNMNNFKNPPKFVDPTTEESKSRSNPNQFVPLPIQFHQTVEKNPDNELAEEIKSPKVFFKKEDEFVDKNMDSVETECKNCSSMGLGSSDLGEEEKEKEKEKEKDSWGENDGNLKIWKWNLNGIGAVCSFGVAAATVCIIIFGNGQTRKQSHHKLQLKIYADDNNNKRIKHVVGQHASRLNEVISAVRVGVPFTRAQITFGGHYDAL